MIAENVPLSRVDDIRETSIPGLYDVRLENGEVLCDLPTVVVNELVARNGIVHRFPIEGGARVTDAERMREALQRCCDESDYCYACDHHPSSGHADGCPVVAAAPVVDDWRELMDMLVEQVAATSVYDELAARSWVVAELRRRGALTAAALLDDSDAASSDRSRG